MSNVGTSAVPLDELLRGLKGVTIDEVRTKEDDAGIHVQFSTSKNKKGWNSTITYGSMSFLIPKDKCEVCVWQFQTKNEPIPAGG